MLGTKEPQYNGKSKPQRKTYSFHAFFMNCKSTPMSSISSNYVQLFNILLLNETDNLVHVKASTGTTQNCSSGVMDIFYYLLSELNRRQIWVVESLWWNRCMLHERTSVQCQIKTARKTYLISSTNTPDFSLDAIHGQ